MKPCPVQRAASTARTRELVAQQAAALREVMDESGVSVRDLATATGKTKNTVHAWTCGRIAPPAFLLEHERLPAGFRERLRERWTSPRRALSALDDMHLALALLEGGTAVASAKAKGVAAPRAVVAQVHDETGRWLCVRDDREAA